MKIDFYVLDTESSKVAHHFACELVEKMYAERATSIFLHTNSEQEAEYFDALLWTYRDNSFLPHAIYTTTHDNMAPILIGYGEHPPCSKTVLLNIHQDIPPFFQSCEQVIEIVFSNPLVQQLARERYKKYRDLGIELNTIKTQLN